MSFDVWGVFCFNEHMTQAELKQAIWDKLSTVIDPELNLDIVSMGLIYSVDIKLADESSPSQISRWRVEIEMTLTTVGCPLAGVIQAMMINALSQIDSNSLVKDNITINLVFDPPWTTDMMSDEAKTKLRFLL